MTPHRVQLRRVKGWRMPPNTVSVARPTKWGNAYRVGDHGCHPLPYTQQMVVQLYRSYQVPGSDLERRARLELRGKNLACWCKLGDPCHADVLLELANK